MKKLISLLLALTLLAGICLIPVQATGETSEVYNDHENMWMQSVTLRTQEGKEGIYYGATFKLTAEQIASTKKYGLALSTTCLDTNAKWTDGINGKGEAKVLTSVYSDMASLTPDEAFQKTSTSLVNIININNDILTNKRNAETPVYVRPYFFDGENYTFGAMVSCSMLDVLEEIDTNYYTTLDDDQLKGMLGMYERFSSLMDRFALPVMKEHYYNGGHVDANRKYLLVEEPSTNAYESLLLEYRRDKVLANMKAQTELVWSIETADGKPIQYSRSPSSKGLDTDPTGNIYTLYPDRTYVGIPYTHGSCSLDMFLAGATLKDGVYVIENANTALFSGGSKDAEYNVSRLGNDCWDAISWAYESVCSSVSADQTDHLTPSYGMYPVGDYDITLFTIILDANGDPVLDADGNNTYTTTLVDQIDHDNDGNTDDSISHRIDNLSADEKNVFYASYAQLKAGDTLVNDTHAIMVSKVNVVYTNGAIDPAKSTVSFYDQASSHERAQSIDFKVDQLKNQSYYHSKDHDTTFMGETIILGDPATCQQCYAAVARDPETGYYRLSDGERTWTFEETLSTHHCIPVAPKELTDASFKPAAARVTDSKSNSLNNLFTGKLTSTYRVSQVSLDIFDGNGKKINSAVCLGKQDGINSETTGFSISRFLTDATRSTVGSVLLGTPALVRESYTHQKTDEADNLLWKYTQVSDTTDTSVVYYYQDETGSYVEVTGEVAADTILYIKEAVMVTDTWLEAPELAEGEYSYTMTCTLGNGRVITFRSGFFTVALGENAKGVPDSHLVSAS